MAQAVPPAPFDWSTFWQAAKMFVVVVVFLAVEQGMQAFTNTFDWSKLMDSAELVKVLLAVGMGIVYGAIQGVLRAVQLLIIVWAGPTLWGYLGPILGTAAAMVNNVATSAVRIFRGIIRKEPFVSEEKPIV